jgi:hypothetical protein
MTPPTSFSPAPGAQPTSQISALRVGALFAAAAAAGITVTLILALAMGAPSAGPVSAGTSLVPSSSSADDEISGGSAEP